MQQKYYVDPNGLAFSEFVPEEGKGSILTIPDGYVEVDEQAYLAAVASSAAKRVNQFAAMKAAVQERMGKVDQLVDNADDLLGGLLGGILRQQD